MSSNVSDTVNTTTKKASNVKINGKPIDPKATYRLATIDYLSSGGDYMKPFTHGAKVAQSPNVIYYDLMDHMRATNEIINPSAQSRVKVVK